MFSIRIFSSSAAFSASFFAFSCNLSRFILLSSAKRAAVSSSESSSSDRSLSTGSSASGFCSNFCRFALASMARRTLAGALDADLLEASRSRSSSSLRKSRLRTSSVVPCPVSLETTITSSKSRNFMKNLYFFTCISILCALSNPGMNTA